MKITKLLGIITLAALLLTGCLNRSSGGDTSPGSGSSASSGGNNASGVKPDPVANDLTNAGEAGNGSGAGAGIQDGDATGPDGSTGPDNPDNASSPGNTGNADNSGSPDNPGSEANTDESAGGQTDAIWMAAGDIMMHMPQLPAYFDKTTQTYNFKPFFDQVKPILEEGDWTMANLETPIAGKSLGYSGFPRFNAPTELADAIKYAGFNIVTNANNHSLDRGAEGISLTLKHLLERGFSVKGTARSKYEASQLTIVEHKGIKMGLLAYTYGTNGIPMPKNKPYSVALIDEAAIVRDIGLLRAAGADFITVVLHFGIEYQTKPNEEQKTLARRLIAAGADIIAGSHPHVLQPYEIVEAPSVDGSSRRGLIIYSMGNFISNQRGDTKDYGVIYKVAIHKDNATGSTTIGEVEPIPTWVYRSEAGKAYKYVIVPLEQTVESRSLKSLSDAEYAKLNSQLAVVENRLESMSAEPFLLPSNP